MTTATKPDRRKLTFAAIDAVVADVESLSAKGYDRAGNWDLSQVCLHLAEWMQYQLDGYPKMPLFLRPVFWIMRNTVGKKELAKILADGFQAGGQTMPQTVFPPDGDAAAAVAKLKEMIERFKAHTEPIQRSSLFGDMTKDQALQLQLRHCAHHLSFLIPRT